MTAALAIRNLSLRIGSTPILSGVDLSLEKGKITALIGRSGSGKSMTALALMGLLPETAKVSGDIHYGGQNLLDMPERERRRLRGAEIAMVFQEPMTALNPVQTIGAQVAEVVRVHRSATAAEAAQHAESVLRRVGLPPEEVSPSRFPHELSGGQRQRVVIAIAAALKPSVLIADEPTTALDVTTQGEILSLLRELANDDGCAVLLITHDLAAVSHVADRIAVIRNGSVAAQASADAFYASPTDELTRDFLPARVMRKAPDATNRPIALEARSVSCDYRGRRRHLFSQTSSFRAVDSVSLSLAQGEHVALVGESGCGKSTLARALLGLHPVSEGSILIDGTPFPSSDKNSMRTLRRKIQIVFQDPYSSFNPRRRIAEIVTEPAHLLDNTFTNQQRRGLAASLLEKVGLAPDAIDQYPHAFSGGQRQRIGIARALATNPQVLVLDEATSALDIAARNRILDLLQSLSSSSRLSLLFITHDLSVVRDIADRVLVMKSGRIVEAGAKADIFDNPQNDYTKRLIASAPAIRWRARADAERRS